MVGGWKPSVEPGIPKTRPPPGGQGASGDADADRLRLFARGPDAVVRPSGPARRRGPGDGSLVLGVVAPSRSLKYDIALEEEEPTAIVIRSNVGDREIGRPRAARRSRQMDVDRLMRHLSPLVA
jgi:hypothetical protein